MRKPLLALLAAAVAALLSSTAVLAAEPAPVRVTELGSAHFPDQAYVVSLPEERTLTADQFRVTENGKPVSGLTVVPATALESSENALVLLIDASLSMNGEPIVNAMAAARAFAAQRNPDQRLGALVFNATTSTLIPFTTDAAQIDAALAQPPPLAYLTRSFDAVGDAVELLQSSGIKSAAIVLLSDGKDLGSRATLDEAVAKARRAHVRIFSVALRSRSFDASPLRTLAEQTGGFYTEAASDAQLTKIFGGLGSQLANEYFVNYRSLAGPGEQVQVRVTVDGFGEPGISGYRTPALTAVSSSPYTQPFGQQFLQSKALMLVVALFTSLLIALALLGILHPRRSTLHRRIGAFVSLAQPAPREERQRPRASRPRIAPSVDGSEVAQSRWNRWQEELEIAGFEISARSIALWTVVGTLFAGWFLYFVTKFALAPPLALLVPIGVRVLTRARLERVRRRFGEQLPDNLEVLSGALRAGHSLVGALSVVVADAPEPSHSEFQRVVADEQLGIQLEDALGVVVHRMASRDLDQVALVARLQRETGASSAEVLERVVENVRDRQDVRRLVRTLTAQGKLSGFVLVALPIFMLLFMLLFNREYVAPMFTETLGRTLLFIALMMVVFGWAAIRRIINIKV